MDARKMFPPTEYLGAEDMEGRGDTTLTISRITMEKPPQAENNERSPIVSFAEMDKRPKNKRKRWVLNKTNMRSIAKFYGFDTDNWIGERVTLYATTCMAWGEKTGCIRVRDRKPQSYPPESETPPSTGLDTRPDSAGEPLEDSSPAPVSNPSSVSLGGVAITDAASVGELSEDEALHLYASIEEMIRAADTRQEIDGALENGRGRLTLIEIEQLGGLRIANQFPAFCAHAVDTPAVARTHRLAGDGLHPLVAVQAPVRFAIRGVPRARRTL